MQFRAAFTRRSHERHRDSRLECLGNEGGLAITRYAFDGDFRRIDFGIGIGLEVINQPAHAPLPGAERAPIIRFARLPFIRQADDARTQLIVVRLDAAWIDIPVAPTMRDGLLLPRWPADEGSATTRSGGTGARLCRS